MPFEYVLSDLIAKTEGALGVVMMDETGEAVDLHTTSAITPYKLRILGAYLSIHLRQLNRMLEEDSMQESGVVHVENESLNTLAVPLEDGYFLVLVLESPAPVAMARRALLHAADLLTQEFFASAS